MDLHRLSNHLWLTLPVLALRPSGRCSPASSHGRSTAVSTSCAWLRSTDPSPACFAARWAPEMPPGYGYPVFNFYGPGAYYLAGVPHLLGFSEYRALALAFAVATLAAGLGMYMLARDIFADERRWSPVVAATAYMVAPYMGQNIYIRGAIAEALGLALLPWIMWSIPRLFYTQHPIPWLLVSAFSLGALASPTLSHSSLPRRSSWATLPYTVDQRPQLARPRLGCARLARRHGRQRLLLAAPPGGTRLSGHDCLRDRAHRLAATFGVDVG